MAEAFLLGFTASIAVWAAGVWSLTRSGATAIAGAPASWRDRFATEYEELLSFRVRDAFLAPKTLWALTFWMGMFVLLNLVDVMLMAQLGAAAVFAAWNAAQERDRQRAQLAKAVAQGMEPIARNRRLGWWYDGSFFVMWLGFFSAACFAARALVEFAQG